MQDDKLIGVAHLVATARSGDSGEATATLLVDEEAVALVAIPRALSHEVVAEEEARLVLLDVCDRTVGEGQSQIGAGRVADPAVGGIEIEVGVVIDVEEDRVSD